jgi:hypothetical protein
MQKASAGKSLPVCIAKSRKKHSLTFCAGEKVDQTLFLSIFDAKSQRRKKVRLFALQKAGKKHKSAFLCVQKGSAGVLSSREHSEIVRLLYAYYPDM